MAKPIHEQEWSEVPTTGDVLCGRRIVAQVVHEEDEATLTPFIAAAPDMARALLEIRDAINSGTLSDDAQEVAERALRKAGVLP